MDPIPLSEQLSQFATRFSDEATSLQTKYSTISELYDLLELLSLPDDYNLFLEKMIPIFLNQLDIIPISFNELSPEHKLRNAILNIMNRYLIGHTSEAQAIAILNKIFEILLKENEENGIICMKILPGLFKLFKTLLQDRVEEFIEIINRLYQNTPELVRLEFDEYSNTNNNDDSNDNITSEGEQLLDPSDKDTNENDDQQLTKDETSEKLLKPVMRSFKMLVECPVGMVTLYSNYKQLNGTSLENFIPMVMKLLNLEVGAQRKAHQEAESQGKRFTGLAPDIINRASYCDFIFSQIKCTSFLAYVFLRDYAAEILKNYAESVPDLIIRLFEDCPSEIPSARKELVHATRHILSTNYRNLFVSKLDLLLDDNVLLGDAFTTRELLRTLAYSTVADFIHNIRSEINLDQIEKIVKLYRGRLLDESLIFNVQIMSAKLLLNLVERILKLGKENPHEAPRAKKLLMIIIDAYYRRFKSINRDHGIFMRSHKKYLQEKIDRNNKIRKEVHIENIDLDTYMKNVFKMNENIPKTPEEVKMEKEEQSQDAVVPDVKENNKEETEILGYFDIRHHAPVLLPSSFMNDPMKDIAYFFHTLMQFLKTIIHDLKAFNPPPNEYTMSNPKQWASVGRVFSYEEVLTFKGLFHECILALQYFADPVKPKISPKKHFDITIPSIPVTATKDSRELMDCIAFMFMQIDSSAFNEIVDSEIEFFYDSMINDSGLLHLAQSLLTNELTSPNFCSILLRFLKKKLPHLGNAGFYEANVIVRLFKLCFMSVNLFPNTNELILLPHLNNLILDSLKYSTMSEERLVYFYLIRTLFRSIGGGRFENLYRMIKPILQVLLQSLNQLVLSARLPHERELYVELCITVPVRLSVLAPYLQYLMKPLVYALQGHPELISQGLRTLELCIDNLTSEYFDPIIEPVIDDISKSLFKLLQPQPFNHAISHTTVKILGKLGGRNRRFLKAPSDLKSDTELDMEINALVKINGFNDDIPLSVTPGMEAAFDILEDYKADIHYRENAFKYLSNILLLFIKDSTEFPEDFAALVKASFCKNPR